MKKLPFVFLFLLLSKIVLAQSSEIVKNYIAQYKDIAIEEMLRTGVPAAITLAQGIHETSAGQSDLVKKSNNHFGIKCKADWAGASVSHDDDARGECFRKYDDPLGSYRDHSDFLKNRSHYAFLFKLDPTDYEAWCYGLKKAGYATNPKYAQVLIKLIRDYSLQDYTQIALERKPSSDNVVLVSNSNQSVADVVELGVIPAVNYPAGIFKINETSVLWISKGTSYLKIAEENDISLARLFDFNDMKGLDIALTNQLIFLQRKRKKGATEFHTVIPGETLHDIAQKEGIRIESLLNYNLLQPEMQPKPGEKLYLQAQRTSMPELVSRETPVFGKPESMGTEETISQRAANLIFHRVQPKETMYAIAKKYDVGVEDIMRWNEMRTIHLKVGQQLRIQKGTANATN